MTTHTDPATPFHAPAAEPPPPAFVRRPAVSGSNRPACVRGQLRARSRHRLAPAAEDHVHCARRLPPLSRPRGAGSRAHPWALAASGRSGAHRAGRAGRRHGEVGR